MPPRAALPLTVVSAVVALLVVSVAPVQAYDRPSAPAARPFQYGLDHFAFANETVWNYVGGQHEEQARTNAPRYTRRCFVVVRAAVQFWKFARYEPSQKPLPPQELAKRIREVTERDAWKPPLPDNERVVFPGYADLHSLSAAYPSVFQDNIGLGWPIYFRFGNLPITFYVSRCLEERLNREISDDLAQGYPTILWLYNFPSLNINHTVVVFAGKREPGKYVYQVYDPNYTDAPKRLEFDTASRTFSYQPTFYFRGGPVTARAVYRGVLQ